MQNLLLHVVFETAMIDGNGLNADVSVMEKGEHKKCLKTKNKAH